LNNSEVPIIQNSSLEGDSRHPLDCEIQCSSNSERLSQLFTGLCDLHKKGWINLTQTIVRPPELDTAKPQHLRRAHLDHATIFLGSKRLFFDMHDSQEIASSMLSESDLYFKRSLSCEHAIDPFRSVKIRPWGLNYPVESNGFDQFALARQMRFNTGTNRFRELWRHLPVGSRRSLASRKFESDPTDHPAKVLFMTRLWNPDDDPDRSTEKKESFKQINENRVGCVRLLRNALGSDFHGGVMDSPQARKLCPDVIVANPKDVAKWQYLELVRQHPICITTTGLHGSTGWRMGEYVAMSRAIISERLENHIPGSFHEGTHYLPFSNVRECETLVGRIFDDMNRRFALMTACNQYYRDYLRPEKIVWQALQQSIT
jgi:hypothetical protein